MGKKYASFYNKHVYICWAQTVFQWKKFVWFVVYSAVFFSLHSVNWGAMGSNCDNKCTGLSNIFYLCLFSGSAVKECSQFMCFTVKDRFFHFKFSSILASNPRGHTCAKFWPEEMPNLFPYWIHDARLKSITIFTQTLKQIHIIINRFVMHFNRNQ